MQQHAAEGVSPDNLGGVALLQRSKSGPSSGQPACCAVLCCLECWSARLGDHQRAGPAARIFAPAFRPTTAPSNPSRGGPSTPPAKEPAPGRVGGPYIGQYVPHRSTRFPNPFTLLSPSFLLSSIVPPTVACTSTLPNVEPSPSNFVLHGHRVGPSTVSFPSPLLPTDTFLASTTRFDPLIDPPWSSVSPHRPAKPTHPTHVPPPPKISKKTHQQSQAVLPQPPTDNNDLAASAVCLLFPQIHLPLQEVYTEPTEQRGTTFQADLLLVQTKK